ncbi:MAG: dihydrofolate reductase family protein [Acidimicrobiales bacterium]
MTATAPAALPWCGRSILRCGRRHRSRPHPRQRLEAGLVDEILVILAPVLLGDGVRLFDHPGGTNVKLERISLTIAPAATNLWLRVVR